MKQSYHNTTQLWGKELLERIQRAKSLDQAVLLFFLKRRTKFTAWEVYYEFLANDLQYPITSVRRACSNLKNNSDLILGELKPKDGQYNEPSHYYHLNVRKHPAPTGIKQETLF